MTGDDLSVVSRIEVYLRGFLATVDDDLAELAARAIEELLEPGRRGMALDDRPALSWTQMGLLVARIFELHARGEFTTEEARMLEDLARRLLHLHEATRRRRSGPPETKAPDVEQQIRKQLNEGVTPEALARWPQKHIKSDFGASHQTYEKALARVFRAINPHWLALLEQK